MAVVTICSDFGAPKIKSVTVSTVSPSIFHEVMGPDAMILVEKKQHHFFFINFLSALGLHCGAQALSCCVYIDSLAAESQGYCLVMVCRLTAVASFVAKHGL